MMRILCADALADELLDPLRAQGHDVLVEPDLGADDLPDRLAGGGVDVLVVRSTKVSSEAIAAAPELGLVVRAGAGTDNVDKEAASAKGVYVANVPGRNAVAVAELTMALLLAIDRHVADGVADLRAGEWNKGRYSKADGIYGKSMAILGVGDIGLAVAERARAFGIDVIAQRKPGRSDAALQRIRSAGVRLVDTVDEMLATADIVSVHVPKAAETIGMCDADFFSKMKSDAIFLNTSRGDVVDQSALLAALDGGLRAGLDVYPGEPSTKSGEWESPLAAHPNVVGSHHIGASTAQAQRAVAEGTVAVIERYLAGEITNCVNLVDEQLGSAVLVVRHLDKVGVLAKVFESLRRSGINVLQMENQLFVGSVAAVATINIAAPATEETIAMIGGDDDVLAVSQTVREV